MSFGAASFEAVRYQVSFPGPSTRHDGDLTLPAGAGPHPAVVLLGGTSGPRDRGRWVQVLALHGLATLTWDAPGWGTTPGDRRWQAPDERAMEVVAAVEFLREVRDVAPGRVAVIGGDTGGWAATLAAALSSRIAALVLLAPPCSGALVSELGRLPQRLHGRGFISAEAALAHLVLGERIRRLAAGQDGAAVLRAEAPCRHAPWYGWLPGTTPPEVDAFAALAGYDAAALLSWVTCPVLGVFGADDAATPAAGNAPLLRAALAASPSRDHRILVLPRTDDAFAVPGTSRWPQVPGDWHRDLVGAVSDWITLRLLLHRRAADTPVHPIPRAG